jgi:hypothetical protein
MRRQRRGVEGQRALQAGHGQAVVDVLRRSRLRQRAQVVARDDALRQLLQFRPRQHGAQLGLADEDDLQQLALAGLQVGQQAQLLQHLGARLCASSITSTPVRPTRARCSRKALSASTCA